MLNRFKKRLMTMITTRKDDLMTCLTLASNKQLINQTEHQLITKTLLANKTPIEQAMLDKAKTVIINIDMTIEDIISIYQKSTHSRYPVINSTGEITGIILMKDLIPLIHTQSSINLPSIIRPAHFVPSSQPVLSLLNQMRHNHQHMSIVLDEYGQFQGIVTIEDLLEQIVGDIEDEHDTLHPEYIHKLPNNQYRVSGLTPIEQFNQNFNTEIDMTEFDTISGIVSKTLGHIPKKGESLQIEHLKLTIHQSSATTIKKINVEILS